MENPWLRDRLIEWISDYCLDCDISFNGAIVRAFSLGLTEENFVQRYADCCAEHHSP